MGTKSTVLAQPTDEDVAQVAPLLGISRAKNWTAHGPPTNKNLTHKLERAKGAPTLTPPAA